MARLDTFTFRVDESERIMLSRLAAYLQRTESDAVRLLIREAIKQVNREEDKPAPPNISSEASPPS